MGGYHTLLGAYVGGLAGIVILLDACAFVVRISIVIAGWRSLITGIVVGIVTWSVIVSWALGIYCFGSFDGCLQLLIRCNYLDVLFLLWKDDWIPRLSIRLFYKRHLWLINLISWLQVWSDLLHDDFLASRALELFVLLCDKLLKHLCQAVRRDINVHGIASWSFHQKCIG